MLIPAANEVAGSKPHLLKINATDDTVALGDAVFNLAALHQLVLSHAPSRPPGSYQYGPLLVAATHPAVGKLAAMAAPTNPPSDVFIPCKEWFEKKLVTSAGVFNRAKSKIKAGSLLHSFF